MENASKALIIAGAILLAILIISLGIMMYTQAQNAMKNTGIDEAEIAAYNGKFDKYIGENVKGSLVKTFINEVNTSNATDYTSGNTDRQLELEGLVTGGQADEKSDYSPNSISSTARYKVTVTGRTGGFYSKIKIEAK